MQQEVLVSRARIDETYQFLIKNLLPLIKYNGPFYDKYNGEISSPSPPESRRS